MPSSLRIVQVSGGYTSLSPLYGGLRIEEVRPLTRVQATYTST